MAYQYRCGASVAPGARLRKPRCGGYCRSIARHEDRSGRQKLPLRHSPAAKTVLTSGNNVTSVTVPPSALLQYSSSIWRRHEKSTDYDRPRCPYRLVGLRRRAGLRPKDVLRAGALPCAATLLLRATGGDRSAAGLRAASPASSAALVNPLRSTPSGHAGHGDFEHVDEGTRFRWHQASTGENRPRNVCRQ